MFENQLGNWKKFREYQQQVREDPANFFQYQQFVRDYRQRKGLEGDVELQRERERQNVLNDWKEFQVYEHQNLGPLEKDVRKAEKGLDSAQKRWEGVELSEANKPSWMSDLGWHKGDMGTAKRELARLNVWLEWIEQQLPMIASEQADSHQANNIIQQFPNATRRRSERISKSKQNVLAVGTSLNQIHSSRVSKAASRKIACGTVTLRRSKRISEYLDRASLTSRSPRALNTIARDGRRRRKNTAGWTSKWRTCSRGESTSGANILT